MSNSAEDHRLSEEDLQRIRREIRKIMKDPRARVEIAAAYAEVQRKCQAMRKQIEDVGSFLRGRVGEEEIVISTPEGENFFSDEEIATLEGSLEEIFSDPVARAKLAEALADGKKFGEDLRRATQVTPEQRRRPCDI